MSTSAPKGIFQRTAFVYLLVSLFCVLFGAVYEHFSHQVYSAYMIYAFVYPLALGVLPFNLLEKLPKAPGKGALLCYHCGIATLTVGSMMTGVLQIYGTTNRLVGVYWWAGILLTAGGLGLYLFHLCKQR